MAAAPADLDATSSALWKSAQKALGDQGTWRPHDVTTLEMLVRCEALCRALREAIGNDYVVEGSRKQSVANPLIKELREAMKQFLSLATALKYTPHSRGDDAGQKPPRGKFDL